MLCEEAPCVCNKPAPKEKAPSTPKVPSPAPKRTVAPAPVTTPAVDIHAAMRERSQGQAAPVEGGEEAGLRVLVQIFWPHLRPEDHRRFAKWKPPIDDRISSWKGRVNK